jgi:hypothetical protein
MREEAINCYVGNRNRNLRKREERTEEKHQFNEDHAKHTRNKLTPSVV